MKEHIIKTELKSVKDKSRLLGQKFVKDISGHTVEQVGRNTMSKMGKRVDSRKKNHARSADNMGRALAKAPFVTIPDAKGKAGFIPTEKKYLYDTVTPYGGASYALELEELVAKDKKVGMMIAIIMRRRLAGTYECIHDIEHKWTSLRPSEDKKSLVCQKCGLYIIVNSVVTEEDEEDG